jgi:hypothetical protein
MTPTMTISRSRYGMRTLIEYPRSPPTHYVPMGVPAMLPNGLELSCPAEAGTVSMIVAHDRGPGALPYPPARRVSFSELLGCPFSCYLEKRRHMCPENRWTS